MFFMAALFVCFPDFVEEEDEQIGELAAQVIGIVEEIELNSSGIEEDSAGADESELKHK